MAAGAQQAAPFPVLTRTVGCTPATRRRFCINTPSPQVKVEGAPHNASPRPAATPRGHAGHTAVPPVTAPLLRGHDHCCFRGRRRLGALGLLPQEGLADGDQRLLRAHHAHVQHSPDEEAGEAEQQELPAAAGSPWTDKTRQRGPPRAETVGSGQRPLWLMVLLQEKGLSTVTMPCAPKTAKHPKQSPL